jgi:hypothetical protein
VGPYLAFNMGGTLKQTSYGTSESMSIKIGNDANTDNLKRTDVGLGINVAYQLSYGLFIRGHFQQGITNLEPGGDSNNSTFSTNSGISFGYLFGVNKKGKKLLSSEKLVKPPGNFFWNKALGLFSAFAGV